MEVARSKGGLVINQRKYIVDLLKEIGLLGCKPVATPMDDNVIFSATAPSFQNKEHFQQIMGKLIYLSLTRPDITFPVHILNQHMHNPSEEHMTATYRVLKYLKGRKSTSGYCTFLWGNLVTWRSKKQAVISRSSAEAKFRALAQGMCEGIWLLMLLREVDPNGTTQFELLSDNQFAIQLAKNPVQYDPTKHVEIDRHFIQEKLKNGTAKISYVPSTGQLANLLTKALPKSTFVNFLSKLGIYNIYTPA
ncbi:hypothetical protein V6N13_109608 [Hibiscus sabdariffa]